ncbi:hypothetical protein Tco_0973224 [Tanacetum coccineum]
MSNITNIKSVHIPDDVLPQLPSPNQTIHEMPAEKIGVYTRFFEYANFRLPLSTFLVNVLMYYRINLSQLSVISAAKVSHFEILCHVHSIEPTFGLFCCFYVNSKNKGRMSFSKRPDSDAVCYTKPLDSLKHWNDHLFWVDSFACSTSFPWHTDKNVSRDPFPKPTEFNADDYTVFVAHPASFWKFSEPFLCLVGMSRNYTLDEDTYPKMDLSTFIQVADPTKVKVGENRLFDEGGSADQRDSDAGGGQDAETELVTGVKIIDAENLRVDHISFSGAATGGKSSSVLKELLASSILNVESGVEAVATLPLVTSSVSATLERESGAPTDSITELNLRTIGPSERFVISSDSSHHSSTNAAEALIDSFIRSVAPPPVMTETTITTNIASIPSVLAPETGTKVISLVHASMFHDSESTGTVRPDAAGSSHVPRKVLSMGSREINSETLHEVFVPQWNVSNELLLDDHDASREFIDRLALSVLFAQIREMDYHHLFMEFTVGTARQACLNAEARDAEVESLKAQLLPKETEAAEVARLRAQVSAAEATEKIRADEIDALKQRNVALESEKNSVDRKVTELQSSVSAKDLELKDLNVVVSSLKSQNDGLVDQVHALETTCSSLRDKVLGYERLKEQIEEFQDAQMSIVNDKVAKLDADLLEMALHLEEKFYPHLLNTISGRRWLLTRGVKLAVVKCLNSQEYLTALGFAISRAIKKGMQDGLSADIDHRKAGRGLEDVVAYNPAVEVDYNSALPRIREVDFPLLAELSAHKDASTVDIMNLLRLESPLADALGMSDLQPDVEQLTLPIHRPEDQVVLGETALLFALSVAHSRVKRIRENVVAQRSTLIDVWVPLVDPLSAQNLIGAASTSTSVPTAIVSTTALSTTFASASFVPPITTDDYEIVNVDG